jgi:glutamine synthetase adenylyltransferase
MKLRATKRGRVSSLQRIHQCKIWSRKRLIRARAEGKRSADSLCLAKLVDPKVFRRPVDFSRVETPPKGEG